MKISHVHTELPKILTRWPLPRWVQHEVCPSGCFCWCIYKAASDPQPSHLHRQLAQQVFICRCSLFHCKLLKSHLLTPICEVCDSFSIFVLASKIVWEWFWCRSVCLPKSAFSRQDPGENVFVCLSLATPREAPCCCTSGEFPSLKGCVCECKWETQPQEPKSRFVLVRWVLNGLHWSPLQKLFDLSPLAMQSRTTFLLHQRTFFQGWNVCYLVSPLSAIIPL